MASSDLTQAIRLCPQDITARTELAQLRSRISPQELSPREQGDMNPLQMYHTAMGEDDDGYLHTEPSTGEIQTRKQEAEALLAAAVVQPVSTGRGQLEGISRYQMGGISPTRGLIAKLEDPATAAVVSGMLQRLTNEGLSVALSGMGISLPQGLVEKIGAFLKGCDAPFIMTCAKRLRMALKVGDGIARVR